MDPTDANTPKQTQNDGAPENTVRGMKGELLARVRELAHKIVTRVNKALRDTDAHASHPTEEKPPLP